MEQVIKEFGIDPVLLVAQIVNFLIIAYILKRYAYKPILDLLKNRESTIKDGLKQAEEARLLLEKTSEKEREVLKEAQAEARKMLDETKTQREEIIKQAEEAAKKQAEIILKDAREQITYEAKETEKRLSAHISRLSLEFLEKSLSDLFTKEEQEMVMKNAVKKIKAKAN